MLNRMIYKILGITVSLCILGLMLSKLQSTGVEIPMLSARPDYVPVTAVQRIAARIWFDCAPAADKNPNHYEITIYDGDTMQVRMRGDFQSSPEVIGNGTFELEGSALSLDDLRNQFQLYDGELIYLKNGNVLDPVYGLSYR